MKKKIGILIIFIALIASSLCVYLLVFKNKNVKRDDVNLEEKKEVIVKDNLNFDLDGNIPTITDFLDSSDGRIEIYFNDELYTNETLDKIGEYKVKVFTSGEEKEVKFNVYDRTEPEVKVKDVTITEGNTYKPEDFIESCTDNSKEECTFEIINTENYSKAGTYEITLSAKDKAGNTKEEVATLTITKEKPKKVETKKEKTTETKQGKYGVTEIVTITTTYDVYSDGSIKNKKTKTSSTVDYKSYNAKAKDLLPEAKENRQKYANYVNQILTATNGYRAEVGLAPLVLDEELTLEAMARAVELVYGTIDSYKKEHRRPDGSYCFTISDELGMKEYWGENLAWGQKDGTTAAKWWRNSPGHYANMTGRNYTKLGVGVIRFGGKYWYVQAFA